MHPHTQAEDSALTRRDYSIHAKLTVNNTPDLGEGFAVEDTLTYDPLLSATIEADLEEPIQRATFRLHLGKDENNISPYMTGGALMNGRPLFDPGHYIGLLVKVVGRTSIDLPPAPPHFHAAGGEFANLTLGDDEAMQPQWPLNHQAGDIGILLVQKNNEAVTFEDAAGFEAVGVFSPQGLGTPGSGGDAVTEVASATFTAGNETTGGTIKIPLGVAAADDLYCIVESAGHSVSDTLPTVTDNDSGGNTWTLIGNSSQRRASLWWKKATSATAGKTVTVAGAITNCSAGLTAYRGGATGNPTTNFTPETNGAGSPSHAGFTPGFANSMICLAVCNGVEDDQVTSMRCTTPGSLEPKRFQYLNGGGTQSAVAHASRAQQGGPTATGSFTWNQPDRQVDSLVWAIKPAGAAPGPATSIAAFWCRATDSNMPGPVIVVDGDHTLVQIFTVRNAIETGNPIDSGQGNVEAVASTTFLVPKWFTTVANCLVFEAVAGATDTDDPQMGAVPWSNDFLEDLTLRADTWTSLGHGGGFVVATGAKLTAGDVETSSGLLKQATVQARIGFAIKPRTAPTEPPQVEDSMPWRPIFHGIIDSADPAVGEDVLEVHARDLHARVLDTWIEPRGDGSGWPIGDATIEVVLEQLLELANISADLALDLDSGLYAQTKFTVFGDAGSTLFIPPIVQAPGSVLLAMREKGLLNGWDLRGRWGTPPFDIDDFVLTYYQPDRGRTGARIVLAPREYFELRAFAKTRDGVRNAIAVTPALPPRTPVLVVNQASIDKYQRLFFGVSEDFASLILHPDQAAALAVAMAMDLGEPKASLEIETRLLPFIEVNDLLELAPNMVHHDQPLLLAISGYTHTIHENGDGTTVLRTRDLPAAANAEWRRGEAKMHYLSSLPPAGGAKEGARWTQVSGETTEPPPPPESGLVHHAQLEANELNPTTGFTVTVPPTVVAGDLLLMLVTSRNHSSGDPKATCTDNDGGTWTEKISSGARSNYLFWRRATAATAGKTITVAGCINSASGGLSVYRGAFPTGDPLFNASAENNAGGDHVHAGFTPGEPNSMICLSIHQYQGAQSVGNPSCANPGTLTLRWQNLSLGGFDCATMHASAKQGADASTGNFTWDDLGGKGSRSFRWSIRSA